MLPCLQHQLAEVRKNLDGLESLLEKWAGHSPVALAQAQADLGAINLRLAKLRERGDWGAELAQKDAPQG
jgi:hypothetical protein